jgi:MFS family permease
MTVPVPRDKMESAATSAAIQEPGIPPFRSLLVLYVVIFFGFVGYSLMITIFTPMIMRGDGPIHTAQMPPAHRTILLGVLVCLYPLGQFVGSPIMGSLSDRFGRKPTLLVSLAVTTACYALIATSMTIGSLQLLAMVLLATGLAEANIVIAQSAISDVVPPAQRNRFFGYIYMSVSAAFIAGPLAGGKLADPELEPWFNYATPFWAVFILLIVTTFATAVLFRETNPPGARHPVSYFEAFTDIAAVVTDRRLRALYWLNFLFYLAIYGFFRCYPMYLVDEFHLGVGRVSEFIAWVGVPIVLANLWLTGFLSAHASIKTLTFWSALMTGIFMVIIVVPRPLASLWVTLFLTSMALALCLPSCATLISVAAGEQDQGRVMGNNQALQVGAESLSGLVGGLLAAVMVKLSLIVLGIVAVVAALILHFMHVGVDAAGSK